MTDPNPADVKADDALIEDIRDGLTPPTDDELAKYLAALRDSARRDANPPK